MEYRAPKRYQIESLLGEGGLGRVALVTDRVLERRVALKFLLDDANRPDLEHEFQIMTRLAHPRLVQIYDFHQDAASFCDDSTWRGPCFAMEYVSGATFDRLPATHWDAATALRTFTEVISGLSYLHSRRILHGDLKPSNLIEQPKTGAKLLDFGLARDHAVQSGKAIGTLSYMPPEAFWGENEERSDLFSLGVVFYQMLTGKLPYAPWPPVAGVTAGSYVALQARRPDVPEFFSQLVDRLLELSPGRRFTSAQAVLRYLRQHQVSISDDADELGDIAAFSTLPWQGRTESFQSAGDWLREAPTDVPMLALTGPVGSGRSRFLNELRWQFQLEGGVWVETKAPGKRGWLGETLLRLGLPEASLDAAFPEQCESLLHLGHDRPLAVVFSDLHRWMEEIQNEVFLFSKYAAKSGTEVRIIFEYADDLNAGALESFDEWLRGSECVRKFRLADLNLADSARLLRSAPWETAPPESWIRQVTEATSGRPLLLCEAIRQAAQQGFEAPLQFEQDLPEQMRNSFAERVARLSPAAQRLLALLLVRGERIRRDELAALWRPEWNSWLDRVDELNRRGLLAPGSTDYSALELAQASLRQAYLEAIDPELKKESYRAWLKYDQANAAREPSGLDSARLAEMAIGAEDKTEAYHWGINAAVHFENAGEPRLALRIYERLVPWAKDAEQRYTLQGSMAPLYYRLGRFEEARQAYARWIADRPDDAIFSKRAIFHCHTGMTEFSLGRIPEAREHFEACLAIGAGSTHEAHRPFHVRSLNFLATIHRQAGKYPEARQCLNRAFALAGDEPLLAGEVELRRGELDMLELKSMSALWHMENSLRHFRRLNSDQSISVALHAIAMLARGCGRPRQALGLMEKSLCLAQGCGALLQWARHLQDRAVIFMDLGNYAAARRDIDRSAPILEVYGNESDRLQCDLSLANIAARCGLRELAIQKYGALGKRRENDAIAATIELERAEGFFFLGNMPGVEEALNRIAAVPSERLEPLLALRVRLAACRLDLRRASFEKPRSCDAALAIFSEADDALCRHWLRMLAAITAPGDCFIEQTPDLMVSLDGFELPELRLEQKVLIAKRLLALGRRAAAGRVLQLARQDWSVIYSQLPEELQMDFEKNRDPALFDEKLRELLDQETEALPPSVEPERRHAPVRVADLPPARQTPDTRPAGAPLGLSEPRFRQFSEISRQIAQRHELKEILDRVMDAAIELTGAERGFLILENVVEKSGPMPGFSLKAARHYNQTASDNKEHRISMGALRQAMDQGVALLTANAQLDERLKMQKSVVDYQLKSILAVPLELEGKILGAIYLDHRYAPDCFRQEDIVLLNAFAAQAALAIQKANFIAELKAAKIQLEAQVEKQAEQIEMLTGELAQVRDELKYGYEDIVGQSPKMMEVFQILDQVTDTLIPVWIYGESGTGKELVARSLHHNSSRKGGPYVTVNCSAIPENLLESELFGHKRGAFTHADRDRQGLFEQANGGTLFLDEVAEMSMAMQVKLLRVLQEGEIRPVGSSKSLKINVRLVTASNRDLERMAEENKFRQDLFFRIKGIALRLPALRERREDIPLLVNYLIEKLAKNYRLNPSKLSEAAYQRIMDYSWPGNIRQLEAILRNAMLFAQGKIITPAHLNLPEEDAAVQLPSAQRENSRQREKIEERRLIIEGLRRHRMNKAAVASEMGITLRCLYIRMGRHNIPKSKSVLAKYLGIKN